MRFTVRIAAEKGASTRRRYSLPHTVRGGAKHEVDDAPPKRRSSTGAALSAPETLLAVRTSDPNHGASSKADAAGNRRQMQALDCNATERGSAKDASPVFGDSLSSRQYAGTYSEENALQRDRTTGSVSNNVTDDAGIRPGIRPVDHADDPRTLIPSSWCKTPARLSQRIAVFGQSPGAASAQTKRSEERMHHLPPISVQSVRKRIRIPSAEPMSQQTPRCDEEPASNGARSEHREARETSDDAAFRSPFAETFFGNPDGTPWSSARKRKIASRLCWGTGSGTRSPSSLVATQQQSPPPLELDGQHLACSPQGEAHLSRTGTDGAPWALRLHYRCAMSRFARMLREWESRRLLFLQQSQEDPALSLFSRLERAEMQSASVTPTVTVQKVLWRPRRTGAASERPVPLRIALVAVEDIAESVSMTQHQLAARPSLNTGAAVASARDNSNDCRWAVTDAAQQHPDVATLCELVRDNGAILATRTRRGLDQAIVQEETPATAVAPAPLTSVDTRRASAISSRQYCRSSSSDHRMSAVLFLPERAASGIVEPGRRLQLYGAYWTSWLRGSPAAPAAPAAGSTLAPAIVAALAVPLEQPLASPPRTGQQSPETFANVRTADGPGEQREASQPRVLAPGASAVAPLERFWYTQLRQCILQQIAHCLPPSTLQCRYLSCLAQVFHEPYLVQTRIGFWGRLCGPGEQHENTGWFTVADLDGGTTAIVTYTGNRTPFVEFEQPGQCPGLFFFEQLRVSMLCPAAALCRRQQAPAETFALQPALQLAWLPQRSRLVPLPPSLVSNYEGLHLHS